jgi:hypothetical protein
MKSLMMFMLPGGEMPVFFSCDEDLSRYDDVWFTRIQSTDFSGERRGSHRLLDYSVAQEELRVLVWGHLLLDEEVKGPRPDERPLFDLDSSNSPSKDWDIFVRCGV